MYNNPSLTYNYGTSSLSTSAGSGILAGFFSFFLILLVLAWVVLSMIAKWKIFTKAGKDGWKALIPVYSAYTLLQILNMEPLLCFLTIVPGYNFMLSIVMCVKLAKSFKKGTGFAIGLILLGPVFEMILGFGPAKYTQLPSSK